MSKLTDPQYLSTEQYKNASNLDARIEIHKRFGTNAYGWNRWVFDILLTLPKQVHILELGCGPAYIWASHADQIPNGWKIILSDLSEGMLEIAQKNLLTLPHPFEFRQIDAQSIPFDNETFDAIIANHMLYHVPDYSKAIAEIHRVLKPGGRLIASTVGDQHMQEINVWLQQVSGDANFNMFRNSFTLESGITQLQPYFHKIEIRRYQDSLQITEIEPLIAYICSSSRAGEFSESALAELRSDLERELQSKGMLFVGKDSGIFNAVK